MTVRMEIPDWTKSGLVSMSERIDAHKLLGLKGQGGRVNRGWDARRPGFRAGQGKKKVSTTQEGKTAARAVRTRADPGHRAEHFRRAALFPPLSPRLRWFLHGGRGEPV